MIIRGNVLSVNMKRTDYAESDPSKGSFLLNKPDEAIQEALDTAKSAGDVAQAALPKNGGTMTGTINMDGQKITNLPNPEDSADPATKDYVDSRKTSASVSLPLSWSNKQQIVSVQGVTTDNLVVVTAAPDSFVAWGESGVRCVAQGSGQLTFACEDVPANALTANILIMN